MRAVVFPGRRARRWRAQAVRSARTWGRAYYVGEGDTVTLDVSNDLLRRQVTLIGSWTFSTVVQAECARFVADRGVAVDRLFTDRWRLDQAADAYRLFDTQTTGKEKGDPPVVSPAISRSGRSS